MILEQFFTEKIKFPPLWEGKGKSYRSRVQTMLSKMSLSATSAMNSLFVGFSVPM